MKSFLYLFAGLLLAAVYPLTCHSQQAPVTADTAGSVALRTVSLFSGKLSLSVPDAFTEMDTDRIAIKYPNATQRPDVVYTDERGTINIGLSRNTAVDITVKDLPELKEVLDQQLQAAKPEDYKSSIRKINGYEYIVLEFITKAPATRIFNQMFVTSLDGKLMIGTFNCTEEHFARWQPVGRQILASVRKSRP
jgi:hypothetical protein